MAQDSSGSGSSSRRGLGRGLGALIVSTDPAYDVSHGTAAQPEAGGRPIPLEAISPNPHQPRTTFEEKSLMELAASIREHGIIQPLIVTEDPERRGRYWLIAGERRWRAAQLAELAEAPVIVREATNQQLLELALVENVQRADLNPLEEAAAYQMLVESFSLTQEEIARRVGRSRSAVANTIRLLQLPIDVQNAVVEEAISAGHARALLSLPDEAAMLAALQRIESRGLNVRQTEELVKLMLRQAAEPDDASEQSEPDPHIRFLEDRFRSALGTRVNLNRNRDGSGRLVVHFYSDEDLDGIFRLIAGGDDEI